MASFKIQNLDEMSKRRLRDLAAEHGSSMEEEARNILRTELTCGSPKVVKLGTSLHRLFKLFGGVELDIPPREPVCEPPRFD